MTKHYVMNSPEEIQILFTEGGMNLDVCAINLEELMVRPGPFATQRGDEYIVTSEDMQKIIVEEFCYLCRVEKFTPSVVE